MIPGVRQQARAGRRSSARALAAALVLLAVPALAGGQSPDAPRQTERAPVESVEGRVVRPLPGSRTPDPIAGVRVTLHRVGSDSAGPIDSLVTGRSGRYAFRWRPFGGEALYLVSAEHQGIAYFGSPVGGGDGMGDESEIVVFDTTSAPVPITVNARHVIVSAPFEGERRILEVYELSNDTLLTAVPGSRERAVWTAIVPESARELEVPADQGVASSAVELRDGRILLFAPFTPGVRQLAFSYRVPHEAFPVSLPVERATRALEVMLEEPTATASGPGLLEADPVTVEGRSFRRFVAQEVPASGVLVLRVPQPPPSSRALYIAVTVTAVGVVMLLVLARTVMRGGVLLRRGTATGMRPSAERLQRQVDALDAAYSRLPAPTDEARAAYEAQRRELIAQRDAALVREGRRG